MRALCGTLRRDSEDWASLHEELAAFALDFSAVLWDDTKVQCFKAVSAWLKGARWKVLVATREKKREAAPSWELTWRSVSQSVFTQSLKQLVMSIMGFRVFTTFFSQFVDQPLRSSAHTGRARRNWR